MRGGNDERVHRRSARSVLSAPVVIGSQVLGHVSELVLDLDLERVVGYEVELASGTRRFLPTGVAHPGPAGIEVASPLHLVEPEYYRRHGVPLADTPESGPLEIDLESGDVIRRTG
jgi:hypothetical protein